MKHQILGYPAAAKQLDSVPAVDLSVPALPAGRAPASANALRPQPAGNAPVSQKSARRLRWGTRVFLGAFCCTLIVLGGFFGIARVDIATRHIGFADGRTFYVRILRPVLQAHPGICKFADLWYNRLVEIVCPQALGD